MDGFILSHGKPDGCSCVSSGVRGQLSGSLISVIQERYAISISADDAMGGG